MQYVSGHPADAYNITLALTFRKTPGATCSNLTRKGKGYRPGVAQRVPGI
jgi:hypothetical protein